MKTLSSSSVRHYKTISKFSMEKMFIILQKRRENKYLIQGFIKQGMMEAFFFCCGEQRVVTKTMQEKHPFFKELKEQTYTQEIWQQLVCHQSEIALGILKPVAVILAQTILLVLNEKILYKSVKLLFIRFDIQTQLVVLYQWLVFERNSLYQSVIGIRNL